LLVKDGSSDIRDKRTFAKKVRLEAHGMGIGDVPDTLTFSKDDTV
jgi:hypothetical protein